MEKKKYKQYQFKRIDCFTSEIVCDSGKLFDEDEANYNFMSSVGKELCEKCIETFSIEDNTKNE